MIVGFGFKKLNIEKLGAAKGKIDINNNVNIKNVEEADVAFAKDKQSVVKFIFEFISKYEPSIGAMTFEGELLYLDEAKKNKDILASWKKEKKVPKELMASILNHILAKCNIQALILSEQVNLPPPIPLPKVQVQTAERSNYIG